jgi:DNA-binding transcriptional LysR family regulator
MPPPFELRVLRYFVAVAEELHFGRAAARLHIAQPSLSVQIRNLEHIVGGPLLVRSSRAVSLTPAGEVLLDHARALLAAADLAATATRRATRGAGQRLVVGFQANAAAELTPKILAAYRQGHPEVQVQMRSYPFVDPTAGLADGSADVAFIRPPVPQTEGLHTQELFTEPRLLAMPDSFHLAARPVVFLEEVLEEPFIARHAPQIWRDFWLATEARGGQPVRIGADVKTVDECFEAILSHQGIAFTQASTQRFYN